MKIGYARVSTVDQELGRQVSALKEAGCELIFKEQISGTASKRPELDKLMQALRKGDVLVIQKLDRLGRSLQHLIKLIETLKEKKVGFISLSDSFDTTSSQGKLMFNIIGAIAEFERDLISERTRDGLKFAKSKGVLLGRRPGLSKESMNKAKLAVYMRDREKKSVTQICYELGIARPTFYRYVNAVEG